ncbi:CalY family protein [Sporosarcina luteola]|uniref:TasA family protein n=1 Tax=Sporosarcina luteola TaxID=582850 RepID=UPI00204167E8|nr:TasA family protein [Sporosarcina luteola]MCM3636598.1 CalY family protein [Sporosarcina luteola]
MALKKKLAMGIATGALAVSMIGGGTYAYFNDVETSVNEFAAGTLDLAVNPETIISVNNLKPGDSMNRTFKLENNGSLDISQVFLTTNYTESVEGFGDHIVVDFLRNNDKGESIVFESLTLSTLKALSADAVDNTSPEIEKGQGNDKKNENGKKIYFQDGEKDGLKSRTSDQLEVRFRFNENNEDQNAYQGANLELYWTFTATQTAGVSK